MNTRRRIMVALAASPLFAPLRVAAQQGRMYRVGYVANAMDVRKPTPTYSAFVRELGKLGWVEGKNLEIRVKSAGGREELFPELIAELVREKPDVIVTGGSPATCAAKAATSTIPIVFGSAQRPVEQRFVASLARPGGNVTGLAVLVEDLGPKRLQLLKELLPRQRTWPAYQSSNNTESNDAIEKKDNAAARNLGIMLEHIPVDSQEDIVKAFTTATRNRVDAINVKADGLLNSNRDLIVKLALKHRIATMGADDRFAEAGGLLSYGENFPARYVRAAQLVDKVLRGTKPAEIPVEQPEVFELVLNLATAKALGIPIPDSIHLQAKRTIS